MRLPSRSLPTTAGFEYCQETLSTQGATGRTPHLAFHWANASLAVKCLFKRRPGWGRSTLASLGMRGQVDLGLSRKEEQEANHGGFQAEVKGNWQWTNIAFNCLHFTTEGLREYYMMHQFQSPHHADRHLTAHTIEMCVHGPYHTDMHFLVHTWRQSMKFCRFFSLFVCFAIIVAT